MQGCKVLTINMEFASGFAGIKQDSDTKALKPEIGWAVLKFRK